MNSVKIMVVAGEASGDQHAARLVQAIRDRLPEAEFFGIGGKALAAQGMRLACRAEDLAVMGLTEVFHKIPTLWQALRALWRYLRDERPHLVILVDFPDFNFLVLRLARWFRVPVMYYISPQVWAWRRGRVKTIARLVNRMVVIFPFEEEFYRQHEVAVTYVGHPLLETLPALPPRRQLRERFGLRADDLAVALLPGSRAGEISQLLPDMLSERGPTSPQAAPVPVFPAVGTNCAPGSGGAISVPGPGAGGYPPGTDLRNTGCCRHRPGYVGYRHPGDRAFGYSHGHYLPRGLANLRGRPASWSGYPTSVWPTFWPKKVCFRN